ncbi:Ankyrin repeat protein [Globisporangium polare]
MDATAPQTAVEEAVTRGDDRPVIDAMQRGDITAMLLLVTLIEGQEGSSSVSEAIRRYRNPQQRSLAHLAIQLDNLEILDFVLSSGLDPDTDCDDSDGNSPMAVAVLARNVDAVRVLLSYGASVSRCDGDLHTLLHLLAMNSVEGDSDADAGMVDLLVRSGEVDVDARDASGNTPLHLAAVYGSPATANRLIQKRANVNAVSEGGSAPLHFAAATGDVDIVKCLINAGADLHAADALGNTPLIDASFVSQSSSPHFAFGDQHTQSKVVKLLLENGADPNAVNLEGNNALFGAVRNGFEDVIDQLGRHKVSSGGFQQRNNRQETLLHVAARAQVTNVSIWGKLLSYCGRSSVNAVDRFERTCLGIWMTWPQSFGEPSDESEGDILVEFRSTTAAAAGNGIRAVSKLLLSIK